MVRHRNPYRLVIIGCYFPYWFGASFGFTHIYMYTTEDLQVLAIPRKRKQYRYSQICSQIYGTCIILVLYKYLYLDNDIWFWPNHVKFPFIQSGGGCIYHGKVAGYLCLVYNTTDYSHQEVIANEVQFDKNLLY